jgi:ProP effector
MPPKKVANLPLPVVIVRRKVSKGTGPSAPAQPIPQRSAPAPKAAPAVTPPVPSVPEPVPSSTQARPSPLHPPLAAPAVTETGPSKKEQEKQARRELLEVLRERWPQAFPRDFRQVRPLAIGINRDIAAYLPDQPLGRISIAIGIFQDLMGPAYYRAVLKGGPRYDLDGNPRGEVTPEEQERAKRDLDAFHARRKKWVQEKRKAHASVQPTEDG